jgi:hypothetical protein
LATAKVARMKRSEIRGGIDASWQSRITLRSIRATHLNARAKIVSLRIFAAAVIDFRLRPHPASKPFCSNVSRQHCRCFNDLQGHRVPDSATAFDNRRRIGLKANIPLTKGRPPEAYRRVGRVRYSRADLQSAPGRLGYHVSRHYDRGGRCFPGLGQAKAGNARSDRVPYVDGPRLARFGAAYGSKRLRSYVRSVVAVAHDRCQDGFRDASSKQEGDL